MVEEIQSPKIDYKSGEHQLIKEFHLEHLRFHFIDLNSLNKVIIVFWYYYLSNFLLLLIFIKFNLFSCDVY
jgi:hypothetical protein